MAEFKRANFVGSYIIDHQIETEEELAAVWLSQLEAQLFRSNGAKHLLSAVASIEQIEEVARQYFEVKYPLMNLTNDDDNDKCEIDWWDMLQFAQHVLSCHCR